MITPRKSKPFSQQLLSITLKIITSNVATERKVLSQPIELHNVYCRRIRRYCTKHCYLSDFSSCEFPLWQLYRKGLCMLDAHHEPEN